MSTYDRVNEPVTFTVTLEESMQLMGALTKMLRSRRDRFGDEDAAVLAARKLLWKLEDAAAGDRVVSLHSRDALDPDGPADRTFGHFEHGEAAVPEHNFSVERQLPDGTWLEGWSSAAPATRRWRSMCTCGWRGQDISGDHVTGREDDDSRELAYEVWDREHAPDYVGRHTP